MLALPADGADVETPAAVRGRIPAGGAGRRAAAKRGRVSVEDIDQRRLILLEEGHCLRDQALAFCAAQN